MSLAALRATPRLRTHGKPGSLRGSLLARFDHAEYRLCRRLNRGVEHTGIRVFFKTASRLGDGVIWYALMLALPLLYGDAGTEVALVMLATSAAGLAVYKILKRTFVRERPFIRHAGISLAGAPLDRYSFPSGHTLHAVAFTWQACAAFPELARGAGAAGAGDRRFARGARAALSDRRARRRLVRRGVPGSAIGASLV